MVRCQGVAAVNVHAAIRLLEEKLTALEGLERERDLALQQGDRFKAHGILRDEMRLGKEIQCIADSVQDSDLLSWKKELLLAGRNDRNMGAPQRNG